MKRRATADYAQTSAVAGQDLSAYGGFIMPIEEHIKLSHRGQEQKGIGQSGYQDVEYQESGYQEKRKLA